MKNLYLFCFITICVFKSQEISSQNIYGFVGDNFVSMNLAENSYDTLITFTDIPPRNLKFKAAIDR